MIRIVDLCKNYGENSVYDKLNLNIEKGVVTSLIGPSGCGKTTLLRILAGLEPYESGRIEGITGREIGYMFQDDCLMPWLNVEQNIAYVLKSRYNNERVIDKIDNILKLVELIDYKNHNIDSLSGGMKRRVSLARTLAYESDIILFDEPFKGLDIDLKSRLCDRILEEKNKSKQTIIIVTHEIEDAKKLGKCIYI